MLITSREVSVDVEGDSVQECIRNFFRPDGQVIPFRIVPSLYNLGLINGQVAVANLLRTIFGSDTPIGSAIIEARSILKQLAEEDRWMTDWNRK